MYSIFLNNFSIFVVIFYAINLSCFANLNIPVNIQFLGWESGEGRSPLLPSPSYTDEPTSDAGLFLHLPSEDGGLHPLQDRRVPSGYRQNSITTQNSKNNANHQVKFFIILKMFIFIGIIYIYVCIYTQIFLKAK